MTFLNPFKKGKILQSGRGVNQILIYIFVLHQPLVTCMLENGKFFVTLIMYSWPSNNLTTHYQNIGRDIEYSGSYILIIKLQYTAGRIL